MRRKDLDAWLFEVGLDLQRISEGRSPRSQAIARQSGWEPRVDLMVGDGVFLLKAEIAGVLEEDLKITYEVPRHRFILRGRRREEPTPYSSLCAQLLEIPLGEFVRVVELPNSRSVPTEMEAVLDRGMLIIWGRTMAEEAPEPAPMSRLIVRVHRLEQ